MRSTTKASIAAALAVTGLWASAAIALAEPTTPSPPPGPKTSIDANGTYKVGTDLLPGVYKSAGPIDGGACYWKRANADNKMIDNGLTKKSPVVVIDPSDASFTTSDCQTWQLTDCSQDTCPPPPGPPSAAIGPLLGLLGSQINPGAVAPGPPPPPSTTAPAPTLGPAPGPAG